MYLCNLMNLKEMIQEANGIWSRLKQRHSILGPYPDCQSYFDFVSDAPYTLREQLLMHFLEDCNGTFDKGDNVLLILLLYPEFRSVLFLKASVCRHRDEILQVWSTILTTCLKKLHDLRVKQAEIKSIHSAMTNKIENNRKRFERENELFCRFGPELADMIESESTKTPLALLIKDDISEIWKVISSFIPNTREQTWLRGFVGTQMYIPNLEVPDHIPELTRYKKVKIRDLVAEAILTNIPRLRKHVKLKEANRRRRNYDQF